MIRVRNEARWIGRALASIMPICERIFVLDDHSDDETAAICMSIPSVVMLRSPFEGLNESRDKNWILDLVQHTEHPDWIIAIDGDEVLQPESVPLIRAALNTPMRCISFRVRYLWDREDQVRVDRVYGQFARQSMFRPGKERFTGTAPGFHTGNVPMSLWGSCCYPGASLLHLGYRDTADRVRKFQWYSKMDPDNEIEGRYLHLIQGDGPVAMPACPEYAGLAARFGQDWHSLVIDIPAVAVLQHAGPLALKPLSEVR